MEGSRTADPTDGRRCPAFFVIERRDMFWDTDVFVVGGGPAGLAAAIAARRKGFRVTVADGAEPPIDKACGEGLLPDGVAALRDLGGFLHPSEGSQLCGVRFVSQAGEVGAIFPDRRVGIGMRRETLHQRLAERAEAIGVSLLWKTPVTGISPPTVLLKDRVVRARWIVGADGIGS